MENELQDWEYPDPDETDDDSVETIVCPACKIDVYEEAEACPGCGYYFLAEDRRPSAAASTRLGSVGVWVLIGLIALFVLGALRGF